MKRIRFPALLLTVVLLLQFVGLYGCAPLLQRFEATYYDVFDTITVIRGYAQSRAEFDKAAADAYAVLSECHVLFDIYHDAPHGANLKTVNDNAGGDPVTVDAMILDLLRFCHEADALTGHKVDATLGAVLSLWHEARETALNDPSAAYLPADDALAEAARHTGFSLLEIDEASGTVRLTDPNARLDVGAVAKGYAAKVAASVLPDGYLLSLGGNIVAKGRKPDGSPWIVGIQHPDDANTLLCAVSVSDKSVVTSGDYQRYFPYNGVRYAHIIDPDTRFPAARWRSVSVLCADSALADALSTALFILDYESGKTLVLSCGADALWIAADGTEYMTDGFAAARK